MGIMTNFKAWGVLENQSNLLTYTYLVWGQK